MNKKVIGILVTLIWSMGENFAPPPPPKGGVKFFFFLANFKFPGGTNVLVKFGKNWRWSVRKVADFTKNDPQILIFGGRLGVVSILPPPPNSPEGQIV